MQLKKMQLYCIHGIKNCKVSRCAWDVLHDLYVGCDSANILVRQLVKTRQLCLWSTFNTQVPQKQIKVTYLYTIATTTTTSSSISTYNMGLLTINLTIQVPNHTYFPTQLDKLQHIYYNCITNKKHGPRMHTLPI